MKENKMKIMCKWCKVSIFCHIVSEEMSDHHGAYGIDSIKMLKIKIHKHYKGKNYCYNAKTNQVELISSCYHVNEKLSSD